MKVFKIVPVVEGIPEIFSAFAYMQYALFVGTHNGTIYKYSIAQSSRAEEIIDSGEYSTQVRLTTKKKIDKIVVPNRKELLCALSDGVLVVVPCSLASHGSTLVKGVSTYCTHRGEADEPEQLCVATRKKLLLYTLNEKDFVITKEISIADTAQTLCWDKKWICAGFKREFGLINASDGTYMDIFSLDPTSRALPQVLSLPDNEMMLIGQDSLGIFFNLTTQQPSKKTTIQWNRSVIQFGVHPPYIIGITLSGFIQVYSIRDQQLYQTLKLPQCTLIADSDDCIFLASSNSISSLHPIPYDSQMKKLLLEVNISQALELLNANFEAYDVRREDELTKFHLYAGWTLFNDLQFPGAFQHFSYAKLNISLLLAFWESYLPNWWKPYLEKSRSSEDDMSTEFDDIIPQPLDIQSFIEERSSQIAAANALKYSEAKEGEPKSAKPSANILLDLANSSLATFLLKERLALVSGSTERLNIHSDVDAAAKNRMEIILKLVDTILFKLLVECDDPRWKELVYEVYHRLTCSVEDCAVFLQKIQRCDALAVLLIHHARYEEGLELWSKIYNKEIELKEQCDTKCEPLKEVAEALALTQRNTNFTAMLLKYGKLIFKGDPQLGLQLVTTGNAAYSVSPDEIIDLITSSCTDAQDMVESYLEHVVLKQRYVEPAQRTRLALIYVNKVLQLQSENSFTASSKRRLPAGREPGKLGLARSKLLNYLEKSDNFDVNRLLKVIESTWLTEEKIILLCKIGNHDEALQLLVTMLRDIPKAEMYCHAINAYLQTRVNEMSDAVYEAFRSSNEIVQSITGPFQFSFYGTSSDGDTTRANTFVGKTLLKGEATKQQHHLTKYGDSTLLSTNLAVNSSKPSAHRSAGMLLFLLKKLVESSVKSVEASDCEYYREAAIKLLIKYEGHLDLDPLLVIPILPDSWPVHEIMPYFFSRVRHDMHMSFTTSVQENLGSMAYLKTFTEWSDMCSRCIVVTAETRCTSCGHPIGDNPVASNRNGNAFHVACAKQSGTV